MQSTEESIRAPFGGGGLGEKKGRINVGSLDGDVVTRNNTLMSKAMLPWVTKGDFVDYKR